jgi:ABC-type lipoprotein release transport system permease subunit
LALSAVGIMIATAVLLVAASVGNMTNQRDERSRSDFAYDVPVEGASVTYYYSAATEFRGDRVDINYVHGVEPDSPKPAGLPALPKAGEMYASPALIELLRSDEGALLRPRLTEKVAGTLDKSMVAMPGELIAWVGADESITDSQFSSAVYGFGAPSTNSDINPAMLALLLIGAVALLMPVFIFVSSASRIAGAERDRRLSALRLVGSGSRQVRRIAAAESLTSAFVGLALGAALFMIGRQFVEGIDLFGVRVYTSDVVPNPLLVVLIVLAIPAVSVLTALFALRRTIIEPLGVVRQGKPVRRHAWWRFGLIGAGVALLVTQLGAEENSDTWAWAVTGGATLLLVGVPVLLPWLVERVAGQVTGGPPSWMLAIRRLQLDSGTSARVVGGVAIVLAGTIALQTVLLSVEGSVGLPGGSTEPPGSIQVSAEPEMAGAVERDLDGVDGVRSVHTVYNTSVYPPGDDSNSFQVSVLDCAALRGLAGVRNCADGDVFLADAGYQPPPKEGTTLEWRSYPRKSASDYDPSDYTLAGTWTVPTNAEHIRLSTAVDLYATVLATPAAVGGLPSDDGVSTVFAGVGDDLTSDQLEGIRNAIAGAGWQTSVWSYNTGPELNQNQRTYVAIRTALYAGSIFTLLLAGISLLVLALEHIRERRRQLAILAASGVPRGVLGRSLMWQVALPIGLGVAVAVITGVGLGALMMRLTHERLTIDWAGVALLGGGAIALCLLVSAMTMPFLRSATRLTSLRTE